MNALTALKSPGILSSHSRAIGAFAGGSLRGAEPGTGGADVADGADFAGHLRKHRAEDASARASESDHEGTPASESEQVDAAVPTEEQGHATGEAAPEATTETGSTEGSEAGPVQEAAHTAASQDVRAELLRGPVTVHTLSALMLQGDSSPRLALVPKELRPGSPGRSTDKPGVGGAEGGQRNTAGAGQGLAVPEESNAAPQDGQSSAGTNENITARVETRGETAAGPRETERRSIGDQHAPKAEKAQEESAAASTTSVQPAATPGRAAAPAAAAAGQSAVAGAAAGAAKEAGGAGVTSGERLLERLVPGKVAKADTKGDHGEFARALQSQVQRGASAALSSKDGTVTLRLAPESLGQLKIKVRLEEGGVHASFEVNSPRTREVLERSLGALRESLSGKGLELESASISVAPAPVSLPERHPALPVLPNTPDTAGQGAPGSGQNGEGLAGDGGGGGSGQGQSGSGYGDGPSAASDEVGVGGRAQILLDSGRFGGLTVTHDGRLVIDAVA